MIFQLFLVLPRPEVEGFTKDTLLQAFSDHAINFLVVIVGIILILLYWNLSNLQFGNLVRSSATHASIFHSADVLSPYDPGYHDHQTDPPENEKTLIIQSKFISIFFMFPILSIQKSNRELCGQ